MVLDLVNLKILRKLIEKKKIPVSEKSILFIRKNWCNKNSLITNLFPNQTSEKKNCEPKKGFYEESNRNTEEGFMGRGVSIL